MTTLSYWPALIFWSVIVMGLVASGFGLVWRRASPLVSAVKPPLNTTRRCSAGAHTSPSSSVPPVLLLLQGGLLFRQLIGLV